MSCAYLKPNITEIKSSDTLSNSLNFYIRRLFQVHISMVGSDKMRISWITEDSGTPATVKYGTSPGIYPFSANGDTTKYKYILFKSGDIHNVVIGPLKPNTVYYYICGPFSSPEFSFKTPPAGFPIKFAVVGKSPI